MAVTIVGLGPGDGQLLTRQAWSILEGASQLIVRTSRHPAVADLPRPAPPESFDHLYETAATFTEVYGAIVEQLLTRGAMADVVYAVPGHPLVGETTVPALLSAARERGISVQIVPGLSFIEAALTALEIDALDGLQLADALEIIPYLHPPLNPDLPLLLGQVYSRPIAGELKLSLSAIYPDEHSVILVHGAGTSQQVLEPVPLYAIDRQEGIGYLTSLYVPPLIRPGSLATLAETAAVLRSPDGCPWDREQTPQSLRPGLLEEVAELLEALDRGDENDIREELGDVLFHLVMQAQMASETGAFTLYEVIAGIDTKLKYRHPHVWGDLDVSDSDEVVANWAVLKRAEKEQAALAAGDDSHDWASRPHRARSLVDDVPVALPALARAQKIQRRVARVGFDWPDIEGVYAKIGEELAELRQAEGADQRENEAGDLLFAAVNLVRWLGIDAETALRRANDRFMGRFRRLEALAAQRELVLDEMDLPALDALWDEVKAGSEPAGSEPAA